MVGPVLDYKIITSSVLHIVDRITSVIFVLVSFVVQNNFTDKVLVKMAELFLYHSMKTKTISIHLFIYILPLEIQFQDRRVGIPLTSINPLHFCACTKPGPRFPKSYVVAFCVQWVQLRWEVIVHFVDIGGIDDHHCLNFLFLTYFFSYWWPIQMKVALNTIKQTNNKNPHPWIYWNQYLATTYVMWP